MEEQLEKLPLEFLRKIASENVYLDLKAYDSKETLLVDSKVPQLTKDSSPSEEDIRKRIDEFKNYCGQYAIAWNAFTTGGLIGTPPKQVSKLLITDGPLRTQWLRTAEGKLEKSFLQGEEFIRFKMDAIIKK